MKDDSAHSYFLNDATVKRPAEVPLTRNGGRRTVRAYDLLVHVQRTNELTEQQVVRAARSGATTLMSTTTCSARRLLPATVPSTSFL